MKEWKGNFFDPRETKRDNFSQENLQRISCIELNINLNFFVLLEPGPSRDLSQ
jgi:hypothetical protein